MPPPSLLDDLRSMVNSQHFSDITFLVEDVPIYAHKMMCIRCPVLHAMLTGEMMESRASQIPIYDTKAETFLSLLEYLYTDDTDISIYNAMDLFQLADRFAVDRLKRLCENVMLNALCIENAAYLLNAADMFHANGLRERCLVFILNHFDEITKTPSFEEVGRTNIDLVFEILKRR